MLIRQKWEMQMCWYVQTDCIYPLLLCRYKGFKGNCATSFIDQFKALHQCNAFCELLGLKSLQPKPKKPVSAPKPKPQPSAAAKKKTSGPSVKGKSWEDDPGLRAFIFYWGSSVIFFPLVEPRRAEFGNCRRTDEDEDKCIWPPGNAMVDSLSLRRRIIFHFMFDIWEIYFISLRYSRGYFILIVFGKLWHN